MPDLVLTPPFDFLRGTVLRDQRGRPTCAAVEYCRVLGVCPSWLVALETNNVTEHPEGLNLHDSAHAEKLWDNNPTDYMPAHNEEGLPSMES